MGLFNFLIRKASHGALQSPEFKGQAYETTAVALPPIRGGLPVAGNGPNTIAELRRAAQRRSELQSSAQAAPAATPLVVTRTFSRSLKRPKTAPNNRGAPDPAPQPIYSSQSRSLSRNSKMTPSFFVNKNPGPPYLIGVSGPDAQNGYETVPPLPLLPKQYQYETSLKSWRRSSVISSRGAGSGGHVDILDAAGVNPGDFRTRVKAAGTRDYGEDVAERNMGMNGVDLDSPAARAFYTLSGGAALAYKSDGGAVDVHGNYYAAGLIPDHLVHVPRRLPEEIPEETQPASMRRRSVHGSVINRTTSNMKPRPLSMYPTGFSFARPSEPIPDMRGDSRHLKSLPADPVALRRALTIGSNRQENRSQSRESQGKRTAESRKDHHKKLESDNDTRKTRRSSASPNHGYKAEQHDGKNFPEVSGLNVESSSSPAIASFIQCNGSSSQQPDHRPQSQRSHSGSVSMESAQQSSRPSTSSSGHPRTRSIGSTSLRGRPLLDDISEYVPTRRSSHTFGSISSAAPTALSSMPSSHQSLRPHSRHSADTSVDLSFNMALAKSGHIGRKDSSGTVPNTEGADTQRAFAPSQLSQRTIESEDSVSTTDESDAGAYGSSRRRKKKDGEKLLFRPEVYGISGSGLPGLFDNGPSNSSLSIWASTLPQALQGYNYSRGIYSGGAAGAVGNIGKSAHFPWGDDLDVLSESESDLTAGLEVPRIRKNKRQPEVRGSIFTEAGIYDLEEEKDKWNEREEEVFEKNRVKMAVRLRKESKRRERLSIWRKSVGMEAYEQGSGASSER